MKVKKRSRLLSLLTVAVLICAMLPTTVFAATADNITSAAELAAVLGSNASVSGNTVTLSGNVNTTENLVIKSGTITLDLAGHTITRSEESSGSVISQHGGNFTLQDSVGNGGLMGIGNSGLVLSGGETTISGGQITAKGAITAQGTANVTISNVTATSSAEPAISVNINATLTVNGGTFTGTTGLTIGSGSVTANINGGNYIGTAPAKANYGLYNTNSEHATVKIGEGASFKGTHGAIGFDFFVNANNNILTVLASGAAYYVNDVQYTGTDPIALLGGPNETVTVKAASVPVKTALTIVGAKVANKVYDGTTFATVESVTFEDASSQAVTVDSADYTAEAVFNSSFAAGTGRSVKVVVELTTAGKEKYTLSDVIYYTKADITPATLTGADSVTCTAITGAGMTLAKASLEGTFKLKETDVTGVRGYLFWDHGGASDDEIQVTQGTSYNWKFNPSSNNYNPVTGSLIPWAGSGPTKTALTISGATLGAKTYDGTKTATVESVTFKGADGEAVTVASADYSATAEFADADAGTGKTVTITVTLTTAGDEKYTLSSATYDKTDASIAKATLTGKDSVTCTAITENGKTLADASLKGTLKFKDTGVSGNFAWDSGDATVVTQGTSYSWTFTPTKDDGTQDNNFNTVTGSLVPWTSGGPAPTKTALTISGATLAAKAYDGTKSATVTAVTFENGDGESVTVDSNDYTATAEFTDANAGTKTAKITVTLTATGTEKYTLNKTTYDKTDAVIDKAEATAEMKAATASKYVKASATTPQILDLPSGLPDGAKYGEPQLSGGGAELTDLAISGTTLTFTKDGSVNSGSYTVVIPVKDATNYNDYSISVTITVTEKTVVTIDPKVSNKTYDGDEIVIEPEFSDEDGTALSDITDGHYTAIWYQLNVGGDYELFTGDPVDAGSYKLVIKIREENEDYIGEATKLVTISKATPKASDVSCTSITTSDKTLADSTLSGTFKVGETTVDGTLAWNDATTTVTRGTSYGWTFTPNDSANYSTVTGTLTPWKKSSGGGGGGGSSTTTQPPVTPGGSTSPSTTVVTPPATVSNNTASTTISSDTGKEIVDQAVKNKSDSITIAPKITGTVTKTEVSIPSDTVSQIGSKTDANLTVSTPVADVTIVNKDLSMLAKKGGDLTVTVEKVGDRIEVTVKADNETVKTLNGGLKLRAPYKNAVSGNVAVLIKDDGTREVIRKSIVDQDGVFVPLEGSAKIEIVDNSKKFIDVPASGWAADAVAFASAHELFNGTGGGRFTPDGSMSRGMIATVIYNMENNPDGNFSNVFGDVVEGHWATEAVIWASNEGVVAGYGNGNYGADDILTREQLAVILYQYAGKPPISGSVDRFNDAGNISNYAKGAMRWAVDNGIISGTGNSSLDPKGTATRVQVATMLQRYFENIMK